MKNLLRSALLLSLVLGAGSLPAAPAAEPPPQAAAPAAAAAPASAEAAAPLVRTVFDSQKRNVGCWDDCHDVFVDCRDNCGDDGGCIRQCFEDQMDCRDLC